MSIGQSGHIKEVKQNTQVQQSFTVIDGGTVTVPKGFLASGVHCGLRRNKRHDIGLIFCEVPAVAAGVYTTNIFQAAPLAVTKQSVAVEHKLQAMLVNSANANACTGEQGKSDAHKMRELMAQALEVEPHLVGVASTGVIGVNLPMDKVASGIAKLPPQLSVAGGEDFCQSILTTDLVKKSIAVKLTIDGQEVSIGGAAKGSGMIEPNMATMLGFITTDALISHEALQEALNDATNKTFNMITVDGDTSTNDMVVAMASGLGDNSLLQPQHPEWEKFLDAFVYVAEHLAKEIARDGEGATKLLEVTVSGAKSDVAAQRIVKTVIGSSLVKTALFGADANWGRIIAAIGYAGERINPDTVDIHLGDFTMLSQSTPVVFDEELAKQYLQGDNVQIRIALHNGEGIATGWGCDLTYEYVRINAAYRT